MPIEPQTPAATEHDSQTPRRYLWYQKLSSILLIIFCLELGCFLLVFPWSGETWQNNFFSSLLRQGYWDNAYLRGAVSGLGVVNLYISLIEMLRLRRLW
jgi:uncharacterized BrkB/YihY/UPF0761 family membrane protein